MSTVATPARGPRRRRKATKLKRRQTRLAWVLLVPSLAVVALVALYPLGKTVFQSFTDEEFLALNPASWVGLENYKDLWNDTIFRDSIWTTLKFTVITVSFEFVLGLTIALIVNSSFKGRGLMRAVMLVPWAIPTVVAAQMWKSMLQSNGVISDAGVRLHILSEPHAWIADPSTALAAVCAVDIWKTTPFVALLLLAGLQVIPRDLYEAAEMDSASPWRRFSRITLPLLMPNLIVVLVLGLIRAVQVFDEVFVLTGGGPGSATMFIVQFIYQTGFAESIRLYGLAAAASLVLALTLLVLTFAQLRLTRRSLDNRATSRDV